jgi:DNA-binding response OmpR family regulator
MKNRVLIVEDDAALALVLRENLVFEGFDAECAASGGAAINKAREFNPDLIILDINLPDTSGFDLCGVLRHNGRTPVIMLTARGQKSDKLRGLHLGADDYVTKPFDLEELLARVHVVLRRGRRRIDRIVLGCVIVDFRSQVATKYGHPIILTGREFEILEYLAARQPRVVYRDELLRELWGYLDSPITRSVDHAIARLRKKIEINPHHPQFIHTIRGDGYLLTSAAGETVASPES